MTGSCGIPATARAVSLNATIVGPTGDGYVALFATDQEDQGTSTINFRAGKTRANNTILRLSVDGKLTAVSAVLGDGKANLVLDVNGYFE